MTLALHRQIPCEPDVVAVVLGLRRDGKDTHEIAVALGGRSSGRLPWLEGAICKIIADDQDRRHALRQADRARA